MDYAGVTLVPKDYKTKDPRTLPYLYPETLNVVLYAKQAQTFYFYQSLEIAEDLAKRQGFILLPWSCIHWERAKKFGANRKIKIGRKSFFMIRPDEMTPGEKKKLREFLEEVKEK